MRKIVLILFILIGAKTCISQNQVIICGVIKNFYSENYSGKLGFPFYYYNAKSEQYERQSPLFQTSDSFYFKFDIEQAKLYEIFFQPLYLVPGDSVHLQYTHTDDLGNLVNTFSNGFSQMGYEGNIAAPSFIKKIRNSIKVKLYSLKDEKNINDLIDSMFNNLSDETSHYLQEHKVSSDYRKIIETDIFLGRFAAKMDHFINISSFKDAIQLLNNNLSLFANTTHNTVDYFSALGSIQEAFAASYHYNNPEKVLIELEKYLNGDNYIYASLIFSNVLRQQLPSYNNPYSVRIALDALENTKDNDLIIFANYILNQEKVNENANEILKEVKVQDYYGNITTIGQILKRKKSNLKFVDLWASWCAPCREGIPFTKKLSGRFPTENIDAFFISTDKNIDEWKTAVKQLDLSKEESYCIVDEVNLDKLSKAVHLTYIPQYLILDSDDKIQVLHAPNAKSISKEFLIPYLQEQEGPQSKQAGIPPPPPPPSTMKKN